MDAMVRKGFRNTYLYSCLFNIFNCLEKSIQHENEKNNAKYMKNATYVNMVATCINGRQAKMK